MIKAIFWKCRWLGLCIILQNSEDNRRILELFDPMVLCIVLKLYNNIEDPRGPSNKTTGENKQKYM